MRPRREAREKTIQFLFQHDLNRPTNLTEALDRFWASQAGHQEESPEVTENAPETEPQAPSDGPSVKESAVRLFADPLITGVIENLENIDSVIKKNARNWDINRMAVVDRNVLRLAIYEMLHRDDIPPVVSINEAIDISKRFSTEDSGRFVNGILDRIKQDLMRPARIAKPD
jgi:N utilization substance protein B